MDIAGKYIEHVQNNIDKNTEKIWKEMVFGYNAFHFKTKYFPKKNIAKGYADLEEMMMRVVAKALKDRKSYVWTSIYVPSEIINSAGLTPLSMEVLSAYMAHGYRLEKPLIDRAEAEGIAQTLCSYHKAFLGACEMSLIPYPDFSVSTSLACDGNLSTMRHAAETFDIPFYFIDVPQSNDEKSVAYLSKQLKELAVNLSRYTGKAFDYEKLRESVEISKETHREMLKFYSLASTHYYPGELIHKMYMMMATHVMMGSREFLQLIRLMNCEMEQAPLFKGKKIMWIHVVPFYQETLKEIFDCSSDYQLMVSDIAWDWPEDIDAEDPFDFLAKRMINHAFNGTMENKKKVLDQIIDRYKPDGIINFCHWGCKQAFGGAGILKDYIKEKEIPYMNLDGDGIDERNSHDGQINTRMKAFLEMVDGNLEE